MNFLALNNFHKFEKCVFLLCEEYEAWSLIIKICLLRTFGTKLFAAVALCVAIFHGSFALSISNFNFLSLARIWWQTHWTCSLSQISCLLSDDIIQWCDIIIIIIGAHKKWLSEIKRQFDSFPPSTVLSACGVFISLMLPYPYQPFFCCFWREQNRGERAERAKATNETEQTIKSIKRWWKKLIIIKMKFIAHLSRKLKGKIQYFSKIWFLSVCTHKELKLSNTFRNFMIRK